VVAALIFAARLSTLLTTPRWLGWPWDAVVLEGFGYGGVGPDGVAEVLAGQEEVTAWGGLGSWQSITVNGVAIPSLVAYDGASEVDLAVVEGRLPVDDDEVALGSLFARDNNIRVGDEVALGGDGLAVDRAEVTGLAVLPAVGPLQSDRSSPGYGMLIPRRAVDPTLAATVLSYIGLSLTDSADPEAVLADVENDLRAMDPDSVTRTYATPVLPPEIVEARALRAVPLAVAGLVAIAAVVGLGTAMVASVRARRTEFGILRALGLAAPQVRRSVRVQSCVTVLVALVLGMPVGIVVGRYAWRSFAAQLGVVPNPSVPLVALVATIVGALAAAVLVALVPGRLATRASLVDALRNE
jgi:putative ABC transport system permease protein